MELLNFIEKKIRAIPWWGWLAALAGPIVIYMAQRSTGDFIDSFGESRSRHLHIVNVELSRKFIELTVENTSSANLFVRRIYFESSCVELGKRVGIPSEYQFLDTSLHIDLFKYCSTKIPTEGGEGVSFSASETRLIKVRVNPYVDGGAFYSLRPVLVADDGSKIEGDRYLYYSGWAINDGLLGPDVNRGLQVRDVKKRNYEIIDSVLALDIDVTFVRKHVLKNHYNSQGLETEFQMLIASRDSARRVRTYITESQAEFASLLDSGFVLRLLEEPAVLPGIGTFSLKYRAARSGRDPATGETIAIPAKNLIKFTPSQELSDAVNSN